MGEGVGGGGRVGKVRLEEYGGHYEFMTGIEWGSVGAFGIGRGSRLVDCGTVLYGLLGYVYHVCMIGMGSFWS